MNTFKDIMNTCDRLSKYNLDRETKFHKPKWYDILPYNLLPMLILYIIVPILFISYVLLFK